MMVAREIYFLPWFIDVVILTRICVKLKKHSLLVRELQNSTLLLGKQMRKEYQPPRAGQLFFKASLRGLWSPV